MKVEIYPLKRREEKGIGKLLPKEPRTITDVRYKKYRMLVTLTVKVTP